MESPIEISVTPTKLENIKVTSEDIQIRQRHEHFQKSDNDCDFNEVDDFTIETSDGAILKCNRCSSDVLMTIPQLKMHYKAYHKGKRLPDSVYTPQEYLICELCDTRFSTPEYLKEHISNEHTKQYECGTCQVRFNKAIEYVVHCKTHADDNMFQCIYCEHKTGTVRDITSHLSITHGRKYRYTCKTCQKGFQSLLRFKAHDNFHTGQKPFVCELCGKTFRCSSYLSRHKISSHREELAEKRMFECDICHKLYRNVNSLRVHRTKHTGNFPTCVACGKKLSSRHHLKLHMRTHTGEKPFKCTYCEKRFGTNVQLRDHTRTHTGERPYVCKYCSKDFSHRSSLKVHTRSHTGKKPYACEGCQKGFVSKASLNSHSKNCDR